MVLRLATDAMGTRFELVLAAAEEPRLRAAGEEALREIEDADQRLSLFRKDSFLAHLCRSAHERRVPLDLDTRELFEIAERAVRLSSGAFDPTVAPLLKALGLHGPHSIAPELSVEEARGWIGWADTVVLEEGGVRFTRPAVLDLGGIAKGHALDLAARSLEENGVTCALLHGGTSTVRAIGAPPGKEGWTVAIGPGSSGNGEDAPRCTLRDAALAVSSPAGRVARRGDREIHHVLDPRTGEDTAAARLVAVTCASACEADALSTALLVEPDLAASLEAETLIQNERWHHAGAAPFRFTAVPQYV